MSPPLGIAPLARCTGLLGDNSRDFSDTTTRENHRPPSLFSDARRRNSSLLIDDMRMARDATAPRSRNTSGTVIVARAITPCHHLFFKRAAYFMMLAAGRRCFTTAIFTAHLSGFLRWRAARLPIVAEYRPFSILGLSEFVYAMMARPSQRRKMTICHRPKELLPLARTLRYERVSFSRAFMCWLGAMPRCARLYIFNAFSLPAVVA